MRHALGTAVGADANQTAGLSPHAPSISTAASHRDMSLASTESLERRMSSAPSTKSEKTAEGVRLALAGDWTVNSGQSAEAEAATLVPAAAGPAIATLALAGVE